jgi:hypothetical protein
MNQQERTTSALPTGHERPDARSFACAVNGVRVTGTVSHSPINPENYLVTVVVANRTSFDFEIIKRSALRYGVPLVHRVDASGAHRFRWTAATLMARPVLVLLPVEEAFEFGITKCVKWHLRVHDEENEERAAA